MQDMGYKPKKSDGPPEVARNSDSKMQYPTLYLSRTIPKELMDKEVGSMCRIEIVGKIISKGINDREGNGKNENMDIEIHKLGYLGKAGKKTKDEYLSMPKDEQEKYDKEDLGIDEEEKDEDEGEE